MYCTSVQSYANEICVSLLMIFNNERYKAGHAVFVAAREVDDGQRALNWLDAATCSGAVLATIVDRQIFCLPCKAALNLVSFAAGLWQHVEKAARR